MSIGRCIPELVAKGELTQEQADRARELYDGHVEELSRSMAPAAAEATAARRTLDALDFEALEKRRRTMLQVKAQDFANDWLTRGGGNWGGGDKGGSGHTPGEGPVGPVDPKAGKTMINLVEARRKAIEGQAFAKVSEILRRHRAILPGKLRDPAGMDALGMEAFGEDSGNLAAKEAVRSVQEMQEWLRLRANAAGANIAKLDRRGFATHHDSIRVAEAGFDTWWAAEKPRWDLDRMVDEETGQPFTPRRLQEVAKAVHATIASDGALDRDPGSAGRLSFANKLGQHRFIHYKSYADWKASQAQFGVGTAFDALVGEPKGMARAIAAMEVLGPNPEATVRYVSDRISGAPELFEPGQLRARNNAGKGTKVVQRLWDEYTGALRQPENRTLAVAFAAYRAIATAAKLGSAPITQLSDVGFGMATRHFNGLPIAGIVRDYLKLLNPLDPTDRLAAAYLSFVPEAWTSHVAGQHRFLAEELTGDFARHVADTVLRGAGLVALDNAGRQAHGLTTFIYATMVRDRAYGDLEPAWRAALERYRIGPAEWDALRSSATEKLPNGLDLMTPATIGDGEAKTRLLEMAHSEKDFAVPLPNLETMSLLNANIRKGTVPGELLRSSPLMFKTFTMGVAMRHGGRMIQQSSAAGKLGYLLSVVLPVTAIGTLAYQLAEISKGRNPAPMDPTTKEGRDLWLAGMAKGGGLSLVGDLVHLTAEDRDQGWAQFAAGPLAGDLGTAAAAGVHMAQGKPRAAWQLARVAKQNVPGSNIWYARLVIDRMLADQVQRAIDPQYDESWSRMQRAAAERGQDYYWAPGETMPRQAPDLFNAVSGGTHQ